MIYAINRTTKQHIKDPSDEFKIPVIAKILAHGSDVGWDLVQADDDGWIECDGMSCPTIHDQYLQWKAEGGFVSDAVPANAVMWGSRGANKITHYRPILEPQADQPKEWRGPEDGLPPVGTECCYYSHNQGKNCPGRITHHLRNGSAIIEYEHKGFDVGRDDDFRPIRTDRERWADDCVELFIDHYGNPKGGEQYIGIAKRLHDALASGELEMPEPVK